MCGVEKIIQDWNRTQVQEKCNKARQTNAAHSKQANNPNRGKEVFSRTGRDNVNKQAINPWTE